LSFEDRDKIRKERDKKGEPGGSKRSIADMITKQLMSAIISSIQKATATDETTTSASSTPNKSNTQAGNSFGGKESAKRSKLE
jgi:hypothetical protein